MCFFSENSVSGELVTHPELAAVPSGDFSTGGFFTDLELAIVPLIEVKSCSYGILSFPLNESTFNLLKPLCLAENQNEQTHGDKVGKTYQLLPDQFEIKNEKFVEQISTLIQKKIKSTLVLGNSAIIYGKICKLLIYEKGAKSESRYEDTTNDDPSVFGSLIIQLPSVFEGGDLILKHLESSRIYKNSCHGSSTRCMFVAHHAACSHQLKEITSGYRVTLVYSLCREQNTTVKPSPDSISVKVAQLCRTLHQLMDSPEVPYICWALQDHDHYAYYSTCGDILNNSHNFFKGGDKNIVLGLKHCLEYDGKQRGKDDWKLCIASANKRVNETAHNPCRGGWSCDGYCDMTVYERLFTIDRFKPLTENSSTEEKLEVKCHPRRDIINYIGGIYDPDYSDDDNPVNEDDSEYYDSDLNNDSDDEFWGDENLGVGCCANETYDETCHNTRLYVKPVLVLWRTCGPWNRRAT